MGALADNYAVSESVSASVKKVLVHISTFKTRAQARTALFDYIAMLYKCKRLHLTLDCRSPSTWNMRCR